jgi:hypothetical protein
MLKKNVFKLWQSMDNYNDTQLYEKLNKDIDWSILRAIANGTKTVSDYNPMHLKLSTNKALKKDFIQAPAGAHFISEKFKNYFDASVFGDSILLPATINDAPYYAWIFTKTNDCLDVSKSQLEESAYNDKGELMPYDYAFEQNKIVDNRFFKLSDNGAELYYCDEIIGRQILASDLNLMAQPLIFEEADLRKRVVYNNTNLNIQFTEPQNYHLECKQLEKIKANKKLTEKDWEINFKKDEKEFSLLSLYRWQLLVSNNWMQKAEIHIGLTTHNADEYFNYRGTIKPFEFKHKDVEFEARIHEYDWQVVLVAPFKNNYNLYILIINRTNYVMDNVYMQEALEVVKTINFT